LKKGNILIQNLVSEGTALIYTTTPVDLWAINDAKDEILMEIKERFPLDESRPKTETYRFKDKYKCVTFTRP